MEIAQGVVKNFLTTIQGVKIGLMIFNSNTEGGHIVRDIKNLDEVYNGPAGNNKTHRQHLVADVNAIYPDSWTPLAETLYEAGLYFQGAQSYFNSPPFTGSVTTYTSPIELGARKILSSS